MDTTFLNLIISLLTPICVCSVLYPEWVLNILLFAIVILAGVIVVYFQQLIQSKYNETRSIISIRDTKNYVKFIQFISWGLSILTANSLMLFGDNKLLSFYEVQLFVLFILFAICNVLSLISSYACCTFVLEQLSVSTNDLKLKEHLSLVPVLCTLVNLFVIILLKILQSFDFKVWYNLSLFYQIIFALIVGGYAFSKLHLARIFREVNVENPVLQLNNGQQIVIPFGFMHQEGATLLFTTQCGISQLSLMDVRNLSFTDGRGDTISYEHNYVNNKFHWCRVPATEQSESQLIEL